MSAKHLLFIPCERLEGLTYEGALGDRPPVAYQCPGCGWGCHISRAADEDGCCLSCGADLCHDDDGNPLSIQAAIALIWNGTPQPMGIWPLVASMDGGADSLMLSFYTAENAAEIAERCERLGMGRVVVVEGS